MDKKMVILPLLVPAGIVPGGIVSLLELACTGQIYLPILSVINREGLNGKAVMLLTIYCLASILPLVIVTGLAARGIEAQALGNWAKRNLVLTKAAMTLLFVALAVMMLHMAWQ